MAPLITYEARLEHGSLARGKVNRAQDYAMTTREGIVDA